MITLRCFCDVISVSRFEYFFAESTFAVCKEGFFQCEDAIQCVSQEKNCNGIEDCPNGSDETNCSKEYCSHHYLLFKIKVFFATADISRSHYVDLIYRKNPAAEHDDLEDKSCSKYRVQILQNSGNKLPFTRHFLKLKLQRFL